MTLSRCNQCGRDYDEDNGDWDNMCEDCYNDTKED
jgi:DNA-directed RNA polymerase subunit RPC12/RpoP